MINDIDSINSLGKFRSFIVAQQKINGYLAMMDINRAVGYALVRPKTTLDTDYVELQKGGLSAHIPQFILDNAYSSYRRCFGPKYPWS